MSAEPEALTVPAPTRIPWYLRPGLWLARRMTGKDPLPARLLAHAPKAAIAGGLLELLSAHAPGDMDARTLKLARLAASVTAGCPFCIDMNANEHAEAGVSLDDLDAALDPARWGRFEGREGAAMRFARAMSTTPVEIDAALKQELAALFSPREVIVLATAAAQVNYWARLNQSLGIPAAGFVFAPGDRCVAAPRPVASTSGG